MLSKKILLAIACFALGACTTTPGFKEFEPIPPGMGVIYLYRPAASSKTIEISADGEAIVLLTDVGKSYSIYCRPEGQATFIAKPLGVSGGNTAVKSAPLTIDVHPGASYFIRVSQKNPMGEVRAILEDAGSEIGQKEISQCLWMVGKPVIQGGPQKLASLPTDQTITVLDFSLQNLSASDGKLIVDVLERAIVRTNRYQVIDRAQREELLQEIQFSYEGCQSEECQQEIGKLLSSDRILVGSLGKVGSRAIIRLELIDVQAGSTIYMADHVYPSIDELVDACPSIAEDLTNR
jgi:TolB-like protein